MTASRPQPLHLAVALDCAGAHPAAWREPGVCPHEFCTPGFWTELIRECADASITFVTLSDALALEPCGTDPSAAGHVQGRLDAVQIAAHAAVRIGRVGLVPTITVTHTEPFHAAKAVATLDQISGGRAGWCAQVDRDGAARNHFGRMSVPRAADDGFAEASDYVEVVRGLWDSWEDDAVVRDAHAGRYLDVNRLHHVRFSGRWFRVAGPAVTPRPPQGQPLVAVNAMDAAAERFAAAHADLAFVPAAEAPAAAVRISSAARACGRGPGTVRIFADLTVFVDAVAAQAAQRRVRLDERATCGCTAKGEVFSASAAQLVDRLTEPRPPELTGYRLHPAVVPHDLHNIVTLVTPRLRGRGLLPASTRPGTLRERLGMVRPANRFAPGRSR